MGLPLIAVLNGPNLNMLGMVPPGVPGTIPPGMAPGMARGSGMPPGLEPGPTLDDAEQLCSEAGEALNLAIDFRQTNGEGELVSWVQECRGTPARPAASGIVIVPGAYAESSPALAEALLAVGLPVIEVHVGNIHQPIPFGQTGFLAGKRRRSRISPVAAGVICGFGIRGYALALTGMAGLLNEQEDAAR